MVEGVAVTKVWMGRRTGRWMYITQRESGHLHNPPPHMLGGNNSKLYCSYLAIFTFLVYLLKITIVKHWNHV